MKINIEFLHRSNGVERAALTFVFSVIILGSFVTVCAGKSQHRLRPLSAKQVYEFLRTVGREDAVPEGRIVTNGLAFVTGLTLGLTKALGAVFIYDVITANVTADMLNEAEAMENAELNRAKLKQASSHGTVQEVCFNTRRARSLEEADAVAAFYTHNGHAIFDGNKQQHRRKAGVRKSVTPRRHKKRRRNKLHSRKHGMRLVPQRIRNGAVVGMTNSIGAPVQLGAETISGTGTLTTQPTTTAEIFPTSNSGAPTGTLSVGGTGKENDVTMYATTTDTRVAPHGQKNSAFRMTRTNKRKFMGSNPIGAVNNADKSKNVPRRANKHKSKKKRKPTINCVVIRKS